MSRRVSVEDLLQLLFCCHQAVRDRTVWSRVHDRGGIVATDWIRAEMTRRDAGILLLGRWLGRVWRRRRLRCNDNRRGRMGMAHLHRNRDRTHHRIPGVSLGTARHDGNLSDNLGIVRDGNHCPVRDEPHLCHSLRHRRPVGDHESRATGYGIGSHGAAVMTGKGMILRRKRWEIANRRVRMSMVDQRRNSLGMNGRNLARR